MGRVQLLKMRWLQCKSVSINKAFELVECSTCFTRSQLSIALATHDGCLAGELLNRFLDVEVDRM